MLYSAQVSEQQMFKMCSRPLIVRSIAFSGFLVTHRDVMVCKSPESLMAGKMPVL